MTTNINNIIRVLALTNSSKREETISEFLKYSLYKLDKPVTEDELVDFIKNEFKIALHKDDIERTLEVLLKDNVADIKNEKYFLEDEEKNNIYKKGLKLDEEKNSRFVRFSKFVDSISESNLNISEKRQLGEIYMQYLYECFYQYGQSAIDQFRPFLKSESNNMEAQEGREQILKNALSILNDERLNKTLSTIITQFPLNISHEDLVFIESLAEKAECFLSLGLSKEQYDLIINMNIVDWVIIVDTNVLYCILDLDLEIQKQHCKKLIDIINQSGLKIKFQYLPQTLKELRKKRNYFERTIPEVKFTNNQITALLKSNKLDSLTELYYQKKLNNSDTPHPTKIIDYASQILKEKGISIYNSKFEDLTEDKDYLNNKFLHFKSYLRKLNNSRDKNKLHPIEKSDDKIEHDIFLREAILSQRVKETSTLNNARFFGLTIDKLLFGYDKFVANSQFSGLLIPTFFSPEFLFEKIIKLIPVKTDDHRAAFMNAISSQAIDQDRKYSEVAQKTVEFFHSIGIENEELIVQCISDDMFLEEFRNKQNQEDTNSFVESHIEKHIKMINDKKLELENELVDKNTIIFEKEKTASKQYSELQQKQKTEIKLRNRINDYQKEINLFKGELEKIKNKVERTYTFTDKNQSTIEFDKKEEQQYKKEEQQIKDEEKNINKELIAEKPRIIHFRKDLFLEKINPYIKIGIRILWVLCVCEFLLIIFGGIKISNYLFIPLGLIGPALIGIYKLWLEKYHILFFILLLISLIYGYFIFPL